MLNDFTKIWGPGARLPDSHWSTLSLILVQLGLSFKHQQFPAGLLLCVLTVYIVWQVFLFPLGRVSYTEVKSLVYLKFSPRDIVPHPRGPTRKLWSYDAAHRTQETRVRATGLNESPHKLEEGRGLSASVRGKKQWSLLMPLSASFLLWMVGGLIS